MGTKARSKTVESHSAETRKKARSMPNALFLIGLGDDSPSKGNLTRERIIAASARIFRDSGYAGTTMREVAKEAELKAGSLYYHFPSKAELVSAILEKSIVNVSEAVSAEMATLPLATTALERLKAAMRAHIVTVRRYEDYLFASQRLLSQVPPEVQKVHLRDRKAYSQIWLKLIIACRDSGKIRADIDPKMVLWFIIGVLNSAATWHNPGWGDIDYVISDFLAMIETGVVIVYK